MRRSLIAAAALATGLAAAAGRARRPVRGRARRRRQRRRRSSATRACASPELSYDTALTGFAADLNGPQLERAAAPHPAVAAVEPDADDLRDAGWQALGQGRDRAARHPPRRAAPPPALAHPPATSAVAVLDTGIDLANPDLDAVTGTNCVKPGTSAQDDNGHGTNVAGIIAARNTGSGVVGVAPGTRVYAVKVLNNRAVGTLSQFLCGINWVTANAAALNIRVGQHEHRRRRPRRRRLRHQERRLRAQGDLRRRRPPASPSSSRPATAAVTSRRTVPAAYPEVLTVTAMTDTDGLPGGARPGLLRQEGARRPHGHLLELRGRGGRRARTRSRRPAPASPRPSSAASPPPITGTSQAAPHVAGAVALCHRHRRAPRPCAGLAPAGVITRVRADATAAMTLATGFLGDPLRPLAGKVFGPLVTAAQY